MSNCKKNRKQRRAANGVMWQSAYLNSARERMYEQWITSLAVNRFKYVNLPATCDARFLEIGLISNGVMTIAAPKKTPNVFYSTMVSSISIPNVYDNPVSWQSYGNNGWHFNCNNSNGVLVYDNRLRMPIIEQIRLFAQQLARFDRVRDINLLQQNTPYVFTAPQTKQLDLTNLIKQVGGFEPIIAGYDSLEELIKNIDVLDTKVPYIGDKLDIGQQNTWNNVYKFLGITSMTPKNDRLVTDEVNMLESPADLMALDPLGARREALDKLNTRFGLDVQVVWNTDNRSDSYNYLHNALLQAQEGCE